MMMRRRTMRRAMVMMMMAMLRMMMVMLISEFGIHLLVNLHVRPAESHQIQPYNAYLGHQTNILSNHHICTNTCATQRVCSCL